MLGLRTYCTYLWSLTCLFLFAGAFFTFPSFAQDRTILSPGTSSGQNTIGDVVGPSSSKGTLGSALGGGGPVSLSFPTPDVFVNGSVPGSLASQLGSASPSILMAVTDLFIDLPPGLQNLLLTVLNSPDLADMDILELLNVLAGAQTLYDNVDRVSCGDGVSSAENKIYAQNYLLSKLNVTTIVDATTNPDFMQETAEELCEDTGVSPTTDPPVITGSPDDGTEEDIAVLPPGELASTQSACSSNWSSLGPGMRGNNQELHSQIRRGAFELGMDPHTLAGIVWLESGGDPTISNPCGTCSATGLIQFTRTTAGELGYPSATKAEHKAKIAALSVSQQIDMTVRYFKQRGWKPGMSDYQAYLTVHAGNPHAKPAADGATGISTDSIFNNNVLPKIERYRCGGYDWNELNWMMS